MDDEFGKEYLLGNIKLFYNSFLKVFGEKIIDYYGTVNPEMIEIIRIREFIRIKFGD